MRFENHVAVRPDRSPSQAWLDTLIGPDEGAEPHKPLDEANFDLANLFCALGSRWRAIVSASSKSMRDCSQAIERDPPLGPAARAGVHGLAELQGPSIKAGGI
jgi:hypothetical protein